MIVLVVRQARLVLVRVIQRQVLIQAELHHIIRKLRLQLEVHSHHRDAVSARVPLEV